MMGLALLLLRHLGRSVKVSPCAAVHGLSQPPSIRQASDCTIALAPSSPFLPLPSSFLFFMSPDYPPLEMKFVPV